MADVKLGNKHFSGVEGVKLDTIDGGTVTYLSNEGLPKFTWDADISNARIEFPAELTKYINDNLVEEESIVVFSITIDDVALKYDDVTIYHTMRGGVAFAKYEGSIAFMLGDVSTRAEVWTSLKGDATYIRGANIDFDASDTTGLNLTGIQAWLTTNDSTTFSKEIDFSQFAGTTKRVECAVVGPDQLGNLMA